MQGTRRTAVLTGTGELTVTEESIPAPEEGEVVVEVAASAISPGTEQNIIQQRRENPDSSVDSTSIGYQNAGQVVETGDSVDQFEPGDRVGCFGSGYAIHGTHAVVPVNLCVELPEAVSYEEGAFMNLAGTALHTLRRADVETGEYVAVVGLGIVGNLIGQMSANSGCRVMGSDLLSFRSDVAADVGFDRAISATEDNFQDVADAFTGGEGLDGGFLCFQGDGDAVFDDLVSSMKEAPDTHTMGWVVIPGGVTLSLYFAASLGNIDIRNAARTGPGYHDPVYERGADYPDAFVRWTTGTNLELAVEWIAEGELDVESLITHRYSLSEVDDAYEQIMERPEESLGIVVSPD